MTAKLYRDVQSEEEIWLIETPSGMFVERDRDMSWTPEEVKFLFERVEQ